MKILLHLIIIVLIFSCNSKTEQESHETQIVSTPTDSSELSDILKVEDTQSPSKKPIETETKQKTVSFNSLKSEPCNVKVTLYVHQNIDSLSKGAIDMFLQVFSEECDNHVEFSEFSQEMIFEVLSKYPKDVAELITKNNYDLNAITSEICCPLLDPAIKPIIKDFETLEISNPKIDSILIALNRALEYQNNE
ncbi:hypothetical protein SAMN05661096_04126 [Marivirga sericea]|uniref:Uncharacterized protein n=1 Tax=Marivirga sericea TaxID=1028 RepID=A0A1X7LL59_9BACT|nr:hypothetical protein [Marivirga sericea]SMG54224.1 hypothetical protein SAMN05661096_04126 [Marivirga sericea]